MGTGHATNARDSINAHKIMIGKLHGEKSLVRALDMQLTLGTA